MHCCAHSRSAQLFRAGPPFPGRRPVLARCLTANAKDVCNYLQTQQPKYHRERARVNRKSYVHSFTNTFT